MKLQFKEIEIVKVLNEKTLEGTLDAIITINQEGIIEFFNKAAEELWGYTKQDILGKNIEFILPPEFSEMSETYMGKFFKYSDSIQLRTRVEVFIVDKERNKIPVLVTLAEARIGKEYRLTAFIQNIEVELF
jgi:PAS domain S-box-containing protein